MGLIFQAGSRDFEAHVPIRTECICLEQSSAASSSHVAQSSSDKFGMETLESDCSLNSEPVASLLLEECSLSC